MEILLQSERFKLYRELTELLRTQYNLPCIRSNTVAYQASKAAFAFKDGHDRAEYERALPDLVNFSHRFAKSAMYRLMLIARHGWSWNGGSFTASVTVTRRAIWIARWPSCPPNSTASPPSD